MVYNKEMVQDQLVEYISSQLKLGVSREAVKAALVGAGWQAADVEDTLKKVEGAARPVQPMQSAQPFKPAQPAAGASIKVSDLLSASGSAATFKMSSPAAKPLDLSKNKPAASSMVAGASMMGGVKTRGGRGGFIMAIVGGIVIVALGAAAYWYINNGSLAGRVSTLNSESADVASRLASLNAQVQALNASNTALTAQAVSLAAENEDLKANLSFVVVPLKASTSSEVVSMRGALLGSSKTSFRLTTPYGVIVYVSNSKDAKVSAALTPLVSSTSSVMLTGTHLSGSQYITVTSVNGSPL